MGELPRYESSRCCPAATPPPSPSSLGAGRSYGLLWDCRRGTLSLYDGAGARCGVVCDGDLSADSLGWQRCDELCSGGGGGGGGGCVGACQTLCWAVHMHPRPVSPVDGDGGGISVRVVARPPPHS
jgi:hypothetical protein